METITERRGTSEELAGPRHTDELKAADYFLYSKNISVLRQIHRTWKVFYLLVKQETKKPISVYPFVRCELAAELYLSESFSKKHGVSVSMLLPRTRKL